MQVKLLHDLVEELAGVDTGRIVEILFGKKDVNEFLTTQNFEVTLQDVISIAPLVLTSKISMNREWVLNNFHGNTYLSCSHFLKVINNQLDYFMKELLRPLVEEKRGNKLTEKDKGVRRKALRDDFHFEGLIRYVNKYLT